MINRRSIISTIFGMKTTPALSVEEEKKKCIMVVVRRGAMARGQMKALAQSLDRHGFRGPIVTVSLASEPVKIIDLSGLIGADLAEVRRLCAEAER